MYKLCFVIYIFFYSVAAKHEQYDGHAVYNVHIRFSDQIDVLKDVETKYNLDIWSYAAQDRPEVVLVPRVLREAVEKELQEAGMEFEVQVENIKEKLDLEDALLASAAASSKSNRSRAVVEGLSFDVIHTFDVVDQYLVDLANAYPDKVTVRSAGKSIEGRDIKYLRISTSNFEDRSKPIVFVQSLLHAREWVTLPATLYAIKKLVLDVTEQDLVRDVDWIIMPIANPDGYIFSHTNDRFWRKNRARGFIIGDICMGVDLNRNFDFHWGTLSSNLVCSQTFHGRGPFSEPETAAIRDVFAEYGTRVEVYLDIHSFGSMILFGFGTGGMPPNALVMNLLGVRMATAIDAVKWPQHRDYVVGNIVHLLGHVSGGSTDYATAIGIPFSYAYELPAYNMIHDTVLGFMVDPAFIEQAGFETWEGIKVAARFAAESWSRRNRQ
ncbi:hypothetical protein O3G_MSEX005550 [Manduca sexta]|uniref:Peptidase M14 domain-containing protein n=1 Tax=Manduca sexta TaxID=7130 RepID=A0A921YZB8_MANSE|nr:hypothetical protein O3G_MSEX005550 [Manduca sexta]